MYYHHPPILFPLEFCLIWYRYRMWQIVQGKLPWDCLDAVNIFGEWSQLLYIVLVFLPRWLWQWYYFHWAVPHQQDFLHQQIFLKEMLVWKMLIDSWESLLLHRCKQCLTLWVGSVEYKRFRGEVFKFSYGCRSRLCAISFHGAPLCSELVSKNYKAPAKRDER